MFFVAMMWMSLQKWFMFQLNINKDLTVLTVESGGLGQSGYHEETCKPDSSPLAYI